VARKPLLLVAGEEEARWPELKPLMKKYGIKQIISADHYSRIFNKARFDYVLLNHGSVELLKTQYNPVRRWLKEGLIGTWLPTPLTRFAEKIGSSRIPVKQPERLVYAQPNLLERMQIKNADRALGRSEIGRQHTGIARKLFGTDYYFTNWRPVAGFLRKHGKVFIKSPQIHAGTGVFILRLENGRVYCRYPKNRVFKKLQGREVDLGAEENLDKIMPAFLTRLSRKIRGVFIFESEIKGEKLGNKKTEVRSLAIVENGRVKHLADYAKVGAEGEELGNISQGGTGAKTDSVFREIYKKRDPSLSNAELGKRVAEALKLFARTAFLAASSVHENCRDLHRDLPGRRLPIFYSVDLVPVWNEEKQRIGPVLLETHASGVGGHIGITGLFEADPGRYEEATGRLKAATLKELELVLKSNPRYTSFLDAVIHINEFLRENPEALTHSLFEQLSRKNKG